MKEAAVEYESRLIAAAVPKARTMVAVDRRLSAQEAIFLSAPKPPSVEGEFRELQSAQRKEFPVRRY